MSRPIATDSGVPKSKEVCPRACRNDWGTAWRVLVRAERTRGLSEAAESLGLPNPDDRHKLIHASSRCGGQSRLPILYSPSEGAHVPDVLAQREISTVLRSCIQADRRLARCVGFTGFVAGDNENQAAVDCREFGHEGSSMAYGVILPSFCLNRRTMSKETGLSEPLSLLFALDCRKKIARGPVLSEGIIGSGMPHSSTSRMPGQLT